MVDLRMVLERDRDVLGVEATEPALLHLGDRDDVRLDRSRSVASSNAR
jgi:hypothetical protein